MDECLWRQPLSGPRIDFHAHVVPAPYLAHARAGDIPDVHVETAGGSEVLVVADGPEAGPIGQRIPLAAAYHDPAARLAAMEAMGVDVQVLSAVQFMYHYWLGGSAGAELARLANDGIAAMAACDRRRFVAMATVPLQDVPAALAELERVHGLGMRSVEIGTHVAGAPLDGEALEPFWARAAALGTVVFIHPYAPIGRDRLAPYYLRNLLGNPFETALAASRLFFGGVLERHPQLRLCLAHGGGALPAVIGRLAQGFAVSPACRAGGAASPATYLSRVYYDTITHDAMALAQLVARVGVRQVLMGSDYPFDIGDLDPVRTVERLELHPGEREAILGGNAAGLLGLA